MRLGADPEVFIAYGKSVVSAIGRVGGTKLEPLQIKGLPAGYTVQQDNVALEFGIPPCKTKEEFVKAIKIIREHGLSMVKPLDSDPKSPLKFGNMSCVVFPPKELQHPLSHIFGCEPDFNAWTNKENLPPIVPKPGMRSAGGHIHVETTLPKLEVVKALDVTIGLASIFLDKGKDRRKFYGKPGAHRPKPYGVEYSRIFTFYLCGFVQNMLLIWLLMELI
jgi:hypothetical protein